MKQLTDEKLNRLIAVRHDLHAHPQPGYAEVYASEVVRRELDALGIAYHWPIAETGVVGVIVPEDSQAARRPAVALRADLDALPITERTVLDYASQNPGWMHACGHDGHTTTLLAAATLLAANRSNLTRPVKLLFQPAEEVGAGAKRMIEQGVLTEKVGGVSVDRVIGFHNWPQLPLGTVVIGKGPVMAGTERLRITLTGRGGHAAMPHLADDLNLAAATFIQTTHALLARRLAATDPTIFSISKVASGDAHNILPSDVELEGTLRYFTESVHQQIHQHLQSLARGLGIAFDCRIDVSFDQGYPPTINDGELAEIAARLAASHGLDILEDQPPSTAAEDFAFYAEQVPGCYVKFGTADAEHLATLHTDGYDFNDRVIQIAARWLAAWV